MLNLKKATLLLSICSMGIQSYASGTHQDSHANCDHGQCETSTADKAAPKKTIATVNGVAISNHELDKEVQRMNRSQRQMPGMAPTEEQKKQVLDFMIGRILLLEKATDEKITNEPNAVDAEFEKIKARFPDEKTFTSMLSQDGTTPESLKKQISEGLIIQKLMEKNLPDTKVSDADVKGFYDSNPQFFKAPEQVKASHILLKVKADGSDKKDITAKLNSIKEQAQKGGDFAALAKEHSQGPSGANGGDLGFFGKGQMVPAFEKAAFSMKANEISEVIETQFGLHILKVFEKKEAQQTPLSEAKAKIEQHLSGQKKGEAAAKYVEELKSKAKIDITLGKA